MRFGADSPLKPDITRGFEYADCRVDDARLVVVNAMAARERGAQVLTRTACVAARRVDGLWEIELRRLDGTHLTIRARALVNAAGPWVAQFIAEQLGERPAYGIRLVQGSHIIVPRLYEGDHAYILQNEDRRIVFAIPYLERYTLIGTTDREYRGDPALVRITDAEIDYLLGVVNAHFRQPLERSAILHSFAGVRPLCDDECDNPAAVTRDYTLALSGDAAPLLSVFGGKLTTYRKLAEAALARLQPYFPRMGPAWTATGPLPGGERLINAADLAGRLRAEVAGLPERIAERWANSYGERSWKLLAGARDLDELGQCLGADLYAREVDYLCTREWAMQADDILWRRTKLGLGLAAEERLALERYLELRSAGTGPNAA